jgi:hypothetical protein
MPKHYSVASGEYTYPADAKSLKAIQNKGGISKLTPAERKALTFKTVKVGDDCTDMPEPALSVYLGRGWVVETKTPSKGGEA